MKTDDFVYRAIKAHGDKYDYSLTNYINAKTKVAIICKKHGVFYQNPYNHYNGIGCPKCRESIGEELIRKFLDNRNIIFKKEYKIINECVLSERRHLFVDFFLPEYNAMIEFNGMQHYKIVDIFNYDNEKLEEQQRRDLALELYCKTHNIKLLTIKYDSIKHIEDIMNVFIKKLRKKYIKK